MCVRLGFCERQSYTTFVQLVASQIWPVRGSTLTLPSSPSVADSGDESRETGCFQPPGQKRTKKMISHNLESCGVVVNGLKVTAQQHFDQNRYDSRVQILSQVST